MPSTAARRPPPVSWPGAFLAHLPQAVVLSAQKFAAGLHWPLSTPYTSPAPVVDGLFALLVTAVTIVGAAVLVRRAVTCRRDLELRQVALSLAWLGCAANLVPSATRPGSPCRWCSPASPAASC